METQNELQFRQVTNENLGRFSEIVDVCFGLKVDEDYFKWKYFGNPVGELVAFEALDGEKVAAFYGVIPEMYVVNGEKVKIYQSMDTMTHPDYQRRGLFVKLANMTYDRVVETDGHLELVGIPGSNSYHGLVNKLHWNNIHSFKYFFLHKNVFRLKNLLKRKSNAVIESVPGLTPELSDYLSNRKISAKPIQPLFAPDFFDWRVFQHPYRGYKVAQVKVGGSIAGICVYAIDEQERCNIYFLHFNEIEFYKQHINEVMDFLFEITKAQYLYSWEPVEDYLHKAYSGCGFVKNPLEKGLFSYRVPFCVKTQGETSDEALWLDIENYSVQPLTQD